MLEILYLGVQALHHPFTAPRFPEGSNGATDLASAGSWAYDLVFNGFEIGGGQPCLIFCKITSCIF